VRFSTDHQNPVAMKSAIAPSRLLGCVISICAVLPGAPLSGAPRATRVQRPCSTSNGDHDGTVDLNEAKAAAGGSISGIVITAEPWIAASCADQ
jgi:hypothetical protein